MLNMLTSVTTLWITLAVLTVVSQYIVPYVTSNVINFKRLKRSTDHIIQDCMEVTSEPGYYYYKSSTAGEQTVCGIYFLTDPDKIIQIYFDYIDLPCNSGSKASFVDGWELNGAFWPNQEEHSNNVDSMKQYFEFCGTHTSIRKPTKYFLSSQNAAMIMYLVTRKSRGFSFYVSFIKNPRPCNILVEGEYEIYTLNNHGKLQNCSLTAMFPVQIKLLTLAVGDPQSEMETETQYKCNERYNGDYVEIGGSNNLGKIDTIMSDRFCGINSYPDKTEHSIICGVSNVKLISSGKYDNIVTLSVRQMQPDDLPLDGLLCPI